ncbi:Arf-GAP domain and FG repeat-containing protein 2, partial [Stegodyphus mimosarum]
MDRIKSRGNEYCNHIWLGKYDAKSSDVDLSNPDKRKQFMIQKYEEKKYYVDPREAIKKMKPRAPAVPSVTTSSVTQSKSHTVIPSKQVTQLQKSSILSQTFSSGDIPANTVPDLFKDFEKDPFNETKQGGNGSESASFADFSSAFGNSGSKVALTTSGQTQSSVSVSSSSATIQPPVLPNSTSHKKPAPPPPDRYAALADLDNQLHQQATSDMPTSIPSGIVASTTSSVSVFWSSAAPAMNTAGFAPVAQNPFAHTASTWSQQSMICTPNPFQTVPQQIPVGSSKSVLPQQNANGLPNANCAKPSLPNGNIGNSFWPSQVWGSPVQNGQPDAFSGKGATVVDSYNPWAQSFGSSGANPFLNGSFSSGQAANTSGTTTTGKN